MNAKFSKDPKFQTLSKLKTDEGRQEYADWFRRIRLPLYKQIIQQGGDFEVKKDVDEMKMISELVRYQEPEIAGFLDYVRGIIEDLLLSSDRTQDHIKKAITDSQKTDKPY